MAERDQDPKARSIDPSCEPTKTAKLADCENVNQNIEKSHVNVIAGDHITHIMYKNVQKYVYYGPRNGPESRELQHGLSGHQRMPSKCVVPERGELGTESCGENLAKPGFFERIISFFRRDNIDEESSGENPAKHGFFGRLISFFRRDAVDGGRGEADTKRRTKETEERAELKALDGESGGPKQYYSNLNEGSRDEPV